MGKRRDPSILLLVLIAAIPILYTGYQFLQYSQAVQTLDAYKQAPICSDNPACRKEVDATVIESKSIASTVTFLRAKHVGSNTTYQYRVVAAWEQNKTETIHFNLYKVSDVNRFDIDGFAAPFLQEDYFAETYVPVGDKIKIEVWNGRVTILFMKFFTSATNNLTLQTQNKDPLVMVPAAKTFSIIPIATNIYPTYVLSHTQTDFSGSILILLIAEFVIFGAVKLFR